MDPEIEPVQQDAPPPEAEPTEPLPDGAVDLDKEPEEPAQRGRPDDDSRGGRRVLRSELHETQERLRGLERELAEARGRMSVPQPQYQQPPPQQQQDPSQRQFDRIGIQQEALLYSMANPDVPQAKIAQLNQQWHELEREKHELIVDARLRAREAQQPQQQQPAMVETTLLNAEFPEIMNNLVNAQHAKTEMMRLVQAGKPVGLATAREACMRVRSSLGIGRRPPAATDAERSKHTSVSSRAGGAGGNGMFVPSKAQLNSARGYTSHLPDLTDSERVRKWVNDVGRPGGLVK